MEHNIKLDTTGEWLVIGNKPHKRPKKLVAENVKGQTLFIQHAFFFIEKAELVFQNKQLFLTPVPIQNELAYIGTNEF